MERNEMLEILNNQHTAAELVVLTSEMAIECTYVSKKGFKYEWIALDEWPASTVTFTSKGIFQKITKKIEQQSLAVNDIRETALCIIYTDLFGGVGDVNTLFAELVNLDYPDGGKFYLLRNSENVEFFVEYELFAERFFEEFVSDCIPWYSLSDEELEEWTNRIKSEFDGIPCVTYEG